MDRNIFDNLKQQVRDIEEKLVVGNYDIGNSRLIKEELRNVIENYPGRGKLTLSPLIELDKITPIEIKGLEKSWAIDYDLWFDNKLGDLTLKLTACLDENKKLSVAIEDVHTL